MKLTIKEKLTHLAAGIVFTSVAIGGLVYAAACAMVVAGF